MRTILGWVAMGLAGIAVSAWRLRPACLGPLAGESIGERRGRRRWFVPPVDERRPMLWKELFIERVGSMGRVGRWIGLLIVVPLLLFSAVQAGLIGYYTWVRPDPAEASSWTGEMVWIAHTGWWVSALIQLGIGLRAAVAISSERERGTWDALLTSPLEGGEIVVGKVWGSLHSLRWLFGAALWAWTLALFFGAMTLGGYAYLLAETLICGAFMAAVGVRASLAFSTATRSMAVAVGIWLGALGVIAAISATTVMVAWMAILVAWWTTTGDTTFAGLARFPISFQVGFEVVQLALYALLATLFVIESRLRFDRIAGRMAGGALEVAVDHAFHGRPTAPVLIDPAAAERAAAAVAIPADAPADLPLAGDLARREGAASRPS